MDRIECQWCRSQNQPGATSCATCGAPLDAREPGQRLGLARSAAAAGHDRVPVLELSTLPGRGRARARRRDRLWRQGDAVFFEHHVLLWKDEATPAVGDELPAAA